MHRSRSAESQTGEHRTGRVSGVRKAVIAAAASAAALAACGVEGQNDGQVARPDKAAVAPAAQPETTTTTARPVVTQPEKDPTQKLSLEQKFDLSAALLDGQPKEGEKRIIFRQPLDVDITKATAYHAVTGESVNLQDHIKPQQVQNGQFVVIGGMLTRTATGELSVWFNGQHANNSASNETANGGLVTTPINVVLNEAVTRSPINDNVEPARPVPADTEFGAQEEIMATGGTGYEWLASAPADGGMNLAVGAVFDRTPALPD